VNIAWYVQAADTEAEAEELTRASEHWFVENLIHGRNSPFPAPEAVRQARYGPMEKMAIEMRRQFAMVGTGEQVVEQLRRLQEQTHADEFTLVTIPFDPAARLNSYRHIAAAAA
jgi:alkanesulfonate monooxygenase SsuD/methylene tetrahydromethanopterin reductase-like flavin-dependent oxidoreductase (luciferase family)